MQPMYLTAEQFTTLMLLGFTGISAGWTIFVFSEDKKFHLTASIIIYACTVGLLTLVSWWFDLPLSQRTILLLMGAPLTLVWSFLSLENLKAQLIPVVLTFICLMGGIISLASDF